jgi:hypothetical protein
MSVTFGGRVPLRDIVGRDETVTRLWDALKNNSIVINEARRFGKTTLLRLMDERTPPGWLCARTSVQDAHSTSKILELTLKVLSKHAGPKRGIRTALEKLRQSMPQVKLEALGASISLESLGIDGCKNSRALFREILQEVNEQLKADDQYLVIAWDEFPDAIRSIADKEGKPAAKDILSSFRALREDDNSERMRWVLTGSIGFHHVLRDMGYASSLINDLQVFELEPLSAEYANWMAACLLLGIERTADEECAVSIAAVSGGIPYVMELMVKHIRDQKTPLPATQKEAQELLLEAAASPALGKNWTPLLERVGHYYGSQQEAAEMILDTVARGAIEFDQLYSLMQSSLAEPPSEQSTEHIISLLLEDHYLDYEHRTRLYSWRHSALRDIWQARRRK